MDKELAQLAQELHKPARKKFSAYRPVTAYHINDLWHADLLDVSNIATKNREYKFILTCIDVFSKVAYARGCKTKSARDVAEAFLNVLKTNQEDLEKMFAEEDRPVPRLENLCTDEGKEFWNSVFAKLMQEWKINHYHTYSKQKAVVVERWNGTLRRRLWKKFTEHNTHNWIDSLLADAVEEYNNAKHSTIGMSPYQAWLREEEVLERHKKRWGQKRTTAKKKDLQEGSLVRISRAKGIFEKGANTNWSEELFKISKVRSTYKPTVYSLEDLLGQEVKGTFYREELQPTKIPHFGRIEKVLQRKKKDGKDMLRVKWKGYDNRFNSWIEAGSSAKI